MRDSRESACGRTGSAPTRGLRLFEGCLSREERLWESEGRVWEDSGDGALAFKVLPTAVGRALLWNGCPSLLTRGADGCAACCVLAGDGVGVAGIKTTWPDGCGISRDGRDESRGHTPGCQGPSTGSAVLLLLGTELVASVVGGG